MPELDIIGEFVDMLDAALEAPDMLSDDCIPDIPCMLLPDVMFILDVIWAYALSENKVRLANTAVTAINRIPILKIVQSCMMEALSGMRVYE